MLNQDILIRDEIHYLEEFFKCSSATNFTLPFNFSYDKLNRLAAEFNIFFIDPILKEPYNKILSPRDRRNNPKTYRRIAQRKESHVQPRE